MDNEELFNNINKGIEQEQVSQSVQETDFTKSKISEEPIKPIHNVPTKLDENRLTVIYRKPLRDYFLDYIFFILRALFIVLLPICIIALVLMLNPALGSTAKDAYHFFG